MSARIVWTLGHSNHTLAAFLALLATAGIDCIADVRSAPYSRRFPHFGREKLQAELKAAGIRYVWLGEEFGARRSDPALLDPEGRLDFAKVRADASFRRGLERLEQGLAQGFRIALLCSEADPMGCHRLSMIGIGLQAAGIEVRHLLRDGSLCDQAALEAQLLARYAERLPRANLFSPELDEAERLACAYRLHNQDVAYSPTEQKGFSQPG